MNGPNYVSIPDSYVRKMLDTYGPSSMMFTILSWDAYKEMQAWCKEKGYQDLQEAIDKHVP